MLKIRKRQNPSNLREAFWKLGRCPERPKEPLEDPKETPGSSFRAPMDPTDSQIVDLQYRINDFESHTKSLLGDTRRPKLTPEATKIGPWWVPESLEGAQSDEKDFKEKVIDESGKTSELIKAQNVHFIIIKSWNRH